MTNQEEYNIIMSVKNKIKKQILRNSYQLQKLDMKDYPIYYFLS